MRTRILQSGSKPLNGANDLWRYSRFGLLMSMWRPGMVGSESLPRLTMLSQNLRKQRIYNIFFQAASETLRTIAADPKHLGAEIGFFAVLHTWGQNLMQNPHSRYLALSSP